MQRERRVVSTPVPTLNTPPSWPAAPTSSARRRRRRRRSRGSGAPSPKIVAGCPSRDPLEEDRDDAALEAAGPAAGRRRSRGGARRGACRGCGSSRRGTPRRQSFAIPYGDEREPRRVLGRRARRTRRRSRRPSTRRRPARLRGAPPRAPARCRRTLTAASSSGRATEVTHVGLRGEVEDDVGPGLGEESSSAVADVALVERRRRVHVLALARARGRRRRAPRRRARRARRRASIR